MDDADLILSGWLREVDERFFPVSSPSPSNESPLPKTLEEWELAARPSKEAEDAS